MTIRDAINNIRNICCPPDSPEVVNTVIEELSVYNPEVETKEISLSNQNEGVFNISIASPNEIKALKPVGIDVNQDRYIFFKILENGSGWLISSHTHYLYSFVRNLLENWSNRELGNYKDGVVITPSFEWQRSSYDYFLTQEGRIQQNLNRETYVQELARLGFTHIEVNGLASPMSMETGPKDETYPMFYTYCPALDQFVYSNLNKGLYPYYYLSANLQYLKENARLARKYGLTPGLLCFEPRSVPEEFFDKYPMLRGARIDHPFRSFKPRYNMTITHPIVREHYAEMMRKLMEEVPELAYISIWTNDSGAGFEHTKSLYVGRNGGAYMIREWKDDEEISRLAGENALRFFHVLRDAASEINPGFRVITRLESFYGEYDTVRNGLGARIDVETTSLISRGWDMPYTHPLYPDQKDINGGSVYQQQFDKKEKEHIADLEGKGAHAHFYCAMGPHSMFEPLTGIPYPELTYKRLKTLQNNGISHLALSGGTCPPELVPYNINQEIVRLFQYNPEIDIENEIRRFALNWAGEKHYPHLIKAWKLAEKAILAFPNISSLYSTYGFAWYRLWARPFVPNIEAIPQDQRNYYEEFMCTTPHNPNNIDLSRDVLFQLTTPDKCRLAVERIDNNLWQPMDEAISILESIREEASRDNGETGVIPDLYVRFKALRCWFLTQRNIAAWISGVYGYINAVQVSEKNKAKEFLQDMIRKEIKNSEELIKLFDNGIEFMALSGQGETPLMYGTNLNELLKIRIDLMSEHINDEPYIDFDYIERNAGMMIE